MNKNVRKISERQENNQNSPKSLEKLRFQQNWQSRISLGKYVDKSRLSPV